MESNKNEIPTQLNATRETQMKKTLTRIDKFRYFFSTCTLVVYICITIGIEPGFNVYSVYNDKLLYRTHKTISSRRSEYNISYSPTDEEEIMGKKKNQLIPTITINIINYRPRFSGEYFIVQKRR